MTTFADLFEAVSDQKGRRYAEATKEFTESADKRGFGLAVAWAMENLLVSEREVDLIQMIRNRAEKQEVSMEDAKEIAFEVLQRELTDVWCVTLSGSAGHNFAAGAHRVAAANLYRDLIG